MRQYDYDKSKDHKILAAVLEVWEAPAWAQAYSRDENGDQVGNCIRAAKFAHGVLDLLHVECEIAACRADTSWDGPKPHSSIGWGDCRSYMASSPRSFPGHAVVIGHDWLFDAAAEQLDHPGPNIAFPDGPGRWVTDSGSVYTWAPGLRHQIHNDRDRGWHAPAARLARDVRKIVGPCRAPRSYDPNGPW